MDSVPNPAEEGTEPPVSRPAAQSVQYTSPDTAAIFPGSQSTLSIGLRDTGEIPAVQSWHVSPVDCGSEEVRPAAQRSQLPAAEL